MLIAMFTGCSPSYNKTPDKYKNMRWIAPDYSFMINPTDNCKGYYKYNDKKYNIRAIFENTYISIVDTDNKDTEMFFANWSYDKDEHLYIYNISFRADNYKELKDNFAEFVTLNQEALK
jgi:hypothetical protein